MIAVALTIAGSDPSGGAGIQADLKAFHQRGVYGMSVITLLTVQNTVVVKRVETVPAELVLAQLDAVLEDIQPQAAKTGALGNVEILRAIAERARCFTFPLVVDPVMISKHGTPLLSEEAGVVLATELLPRALLVTPNLYEASALSGIEVRDIGTMEEAAGRIANLGVPGVLVKGGHLEGEAVDVLLWEDRSYIFSSARIETKHTHGTGCTYSAAITAELAKGRPVPEAVDAAKKYVTAAISASPGIGMGCGPINHHAVAAD